MMARSEYGAADDDEEEFCFMVAGRVQDVMEAHDKKWTPNNLSKNSSVLFSEPKHAYDIDVITAIASAATMEAVERCRGERDGMGRPKTTQRIDKGKAEEEKA